MGVLDLIREWEKSNLCQIKTKTKNYRCNQEICDFADKLFPDMENMESRNSTTTQHDGIFIVSKINVREYVKRFSPVLLRYDSRTKYPALNFGKAKGSESNRVLIIPHGPIKEYLESGDLKCVENSLEKFYVAVTRAKHSVAFLYDGKCVVNCTE